jgi:hypothetical protein
MADRPGRAADPGLPFLGRRGVPQTDAGDLKMVTEWAKLGFVIRNPFLPPNVYVTAATGTDLIYVSVEPRQR